MKACLHTRQELSNCGKWSDKLQAYLWQGLQVEEYLERATHVRLAQQRHALPEGLLCPALDLQPRDSQIALRPWPLKGTSKAVHATRPELQGLIRLDLACSSNVQCALTWAAETDVQQPPLSSRSRGELYASDMV